jgi:hypothetical protein
MRAIAGGMAVQVVVAAAKLGLADAMKDGPVPVAEIAARTRTHAPTLYRLLRALASLQIVIQHAEPAYGSSTAAETAVSFSLAPAGEMLRSDVPGSWRALVTMWGMPWRNRAYEHLDDCVRTGTSGVEHALGMDLWKYLDQHKPEFDNFNEAMTSAASTAHPIAAAAYDFSRFHQVADIGGGHGGLLVTILDRYPDLRGILFDRPQVIDEARALPACARASDRLQLVGGDFFVQVPGGADAYIMSHLLHNWNDEQATSILRNCRASMRTGATLLVLEAVIQPGSEPDFGKFMDIEMLVFFGGRDRTAEEFAALFQAAGFTFNRVIPTRSTISIVEGTAV